MKRLIINWIVIFLFTFLRFNHVEAQIPTKHLLQWFNAQNVILNPGQDSVNTLIDLSGNNNPAQRSFFGPLAQLPLIDSTECEMNYQPVIHFPGNSRLQSHVPELSSAYTMFIVVGSFIPNVSPPIDPLLSCNTVPNVAGTIYGNVNGQFRIQDQVPGQVYDTALVRSYEIRMLTRSNTFVNEDYVNGSLVGSGSLSGTMNFGSIGGRVEASQFLNGDLAEIIIYDTLISSIQIDSTFSYLRNKFSTLANLGGNQIGNLCYKKLSPGNCFRSYTWSTGETTASILPSIPGKYWVRTVNYFGFVSSDTVLIQPAVPISIKDSVNCNGSPIVWNTGLNKTNYSFLWSDNSKDSEFIATIPGKYSVKITDLTGCSLLTDTFLLVPDSFTLTASLGPDKMKLCYGQKIALINSASSARTYSWSNHATSSSITILDSGNYYLTVSDVYNCIALDSVHVSIKGVAPIVKFGIKNVKFCQFDSLVFNDLSSDTSHIDFIKSWFWNFGDLTNSSLQNPTHLFSVPDYGYFNIKLTDTTNAGCFNSIDSTIQIFPKPTASFSNSPIVCNGYEIQFKQMDKLFGYPALHYFWNFGSGPSDSSNMPNPICVFKNTGTFSIRQWVVNNHGCFSDTITIPLTVNPSPVAKFSVSLACAGKEVIISDHSTSVSPIEDHKIFFGDLTQTHINVINNLIHTYSNPGTDTLIIIDSALNECVDTFKLPVVVHNLPVNTFTITGSPLCINSGVNFSSLAYVPLPDTVDSWKWVIDGTKIVSGKTESFITMPFATSGKHSIMLVAGSSSGCIDSSTVQTVIIHPLPNASFTPTAASVESDPPVNLLLNPLQNDPNDNYLWNFGSGKTSALIHPSVSYSAADTGIHTVLLTLTDTLGCTDTSSQHYDIQFGKYDVGLCPVTASVDANDFLSVYVSFTNNSPNRILNSLNFVVDIEGDEGFMESWYGTLGPGGSLSGYELKTHPRLSSSSEHTYVCVTATEPDGHSDIHPNDNTCCSTLNNNNAFFLPNPSPNPTNGFITIPFIVPAAGTVQINLFNALGQKVIDSINYSAVKGYNSLYYYTADLASGVYIYQIDYGNSQLSRKFVKINVQ